MAVQISFSDLKQKVDSGWKKDQLAQHFGLPMAQMTKVLQQAGLQIRKFHRPKFELVMDENVELAQEAGDEVETTNEVEDIVPDVAPDENDPTRW